MILKASQRGGAKDLALHLLKDENERVDVHEIRGFTSDNLVHALNEVYAVSRGTRAKQYLFSLSLNPPQDAKVRTEDFEAAIEKVENKLKLSDQPRAIVFHEKEGRRHCHAVWSRIDTREMKAIRMSHYKNKLMEISRDLYIEHGWEMPHGMRDKKQRDPVNFTLAEWQQAKRVGQDPRSIKHDLRLAWNASDTQATLVNALKQKGYTLAKGDRRSFVVLDQYCEVYSLPKWCGIKTKETKDRITDKDALPSVSEAREKIAAEMNKRLVDLGNQRNKAIWERINKLKEQQAELAQKHRTAMDALKLAQEKRWKEENLARKMRFKKGLHGWLNKVTGKHSRIEKENEIDMLRAAQRDQKERDDLIYQQLPQRRIISSRIKKLSTFDHELSVDLDRDVGLYQDIESGSQASFDLAESFKGHTGRGNGLER